MSTSVALIIFALAGAAAVGSSAIVRGVGRGFLAGSMRPDEVARSFVAVENEWQAQASFFAECGSNSTQGTEDDSIDCHAAPVAFAASCDKVVQAVLHGSSGDRSVAREYLFDVCGQSEMTGWHKDRCHSLADAIDGSMTDDSYRNREHFDGASVCSRFWTQVLAEEQTRVTHEREEESKKRAAEEAARVAAEADAAKKAAEAEKKAAEEEAAKQAAEEAAKKAAQEEAAKQASEAEATKKAAAEAEKKAPEDADTKATEEASRREEDAKAQVPTHAAKKAAGASNSTNTTELKL